MEGESWMEIRNDRQKGLSYAEIARKYHIDPRTAKKYAESDTRPVYSLTDAKPSKLDPYKEQIMIWLEEAPYSAMRIWEKVKELSAPVIKCKKMPVKKCRFPTGRNAIWYTRICLPWGGRKGCQNGRSKLDGYPKRPAKRTELHRDRTQVQH